MRDPTQTRSIRREAEKALRAFLKRVRADLESKLLDHNVSQVLEQINVELVRNDVALLVDSTWEKARFFVFDLFKNFTSIFNSDREMMIERIMAFMKGNIDRLLRGIFNHITNYRSGIISFSDLMRNFRKEFRKSFVSFKRIIRTETVRAYNLSILKQGQTIENMTGKKVKYLWKTQEDELVRATHRRLNNKLMTRKQANQWLGQPNCRCSLTPKVV